MRLSVEKMQVPHLVVVANAEKRGLADTRFISASPQFGRVDNPRRQSTWTNAPARGNRCSLLQRGAERRILYRCCSTPTLNPCSMHVFDCAHNAGKGLVQWMISSSMCFFRESLIFFLRNVGHKRS